MTSTPEPAAAADETAAVDTAAGEPVETGAHEAGMTEPVEPASSEPVSAEPAAPDERLLAAHDLARAALLEVTPATSVGDPVDYIVEADGVVSLRFANRLTGYPGWLWTVSVAVVDDAEPTVLEVELLPAAGALLAPEWVPWAVRLADYQAAQAASGDADADDADGDDDTDLDDADELDDDADLDDDDDDDDDDDADEFADGSTAVTHGGDVDGVDIDALDEDGSEDDAEDDDADDDDSDDADDDDLDESVHDESPWER